VALGNPASIGESWTLNGTGANLADLYLMFVTPLPGTITLAGQAQGVTYQPANVGLTLGPEWVIFQVDANSNPVYYPAISLGLLGSSEHRQLALLHVLNHPQLFSEPFNYELGLPKWTVSFVSVPIPEPASGVLVLMGLLGIGIARRERS
jgi:hypothetical protein